MIGVKKGMIIRCIINESYLFSPRKVREGLSQKTSYDYIELARTPLDDEKYE